MNMKKLMICLALIMSLMSLGYSESTFAADNNPIDKAKVSLDHSEPAVSTKLWIDWRHEVSLSAYISKYSTHSVIVTFKDPSGKVIKSTVVRPGGSVGKYIWWPKTGYYYLTLDCYGTNKDCRASGSITETD